MAFSSARTSGRGSEGPELEGHDAERDKGMWKMQVAAVAGKATEIERFQLSSDRENEPSGNSLSQSNDEGHEEKTSTPIFQHLARQEQQLMPQAQQRLAQETQHSDIAVQKFQAESDCKFCSIIVAYFNSVYSPGNRGRPGKYMGDIPLGQRRDILSSNCPHTTWFNNIGICPGLDPVYESCEIILEAGPTKRTWKTFVAVYETQSSSTTFESARFELIRRPEVPSHEGRGRILDASWVGSTSNSSEIGVRGVFWNMEAVATSQRSVPGVHSVHRG